MNELIVLTGPKGCGKSTAAFTATPPSEIDKLCIVDTEMSMSDLVRQAKPGAYIPAYERLRLTPGTLDAMAKGQLPWVNRDQKNQLVAYYEWLVQTLATRLESGKFTTLVIDTIEPIEAAMTAAVQADKNKFGWSGSMAYGRLETEGIRPLYENLLQAIYARGVRRIVLTTHLKNVWLGTNIVPNKVKPGGRLTVLARLSTAMFWLVPDVRNADGAPAALVLKARMGVLSPDPVTNTWAMRRVLPRRIPHFTWADVSSYFVQPADLANPHPSEVPTRAEQEMMSELLTDEQMRLMIAGADAEQAEATSLLITPKPTPEQVLQMAGEGHDADTIARTLEMPLPVVRRYLTQALETSE
jgi:hypothetical protein